MHHTPPPRHLLLAVAVVAVWGINFTVIKVALGDFPPLMFAALRFTLAFLPAAFFLKRPAVPIGTLAAYGVFIGAGQFGLLYVAMKSDISPGMASLVLQTQVFFTIGLSMALAGERVKAYQVAALALAVAGIAVIGANTERPSLCSLPGAGPHCASISRRCGSRRTMSSAAMRACTWAGVP